MDANVEESAREEPEQLMESELDLVAVVGSLRSESINRAVFVSARELLPEDVNLTEIDIRNVPLYDADVEAEGDPAAVASLKAAVAAADGLVFFTPEYNRSVPAVTKNLVDWLSRPYQASPLAGKPAGIVAAVLGGHTATGARDHLAIAVGAITDRLLDESLGLGDMRDAIDGGRITDEAQRQQLREWLHRFIRYARRLRIEDQAAGQSSPTRAGTG